MEFKFKQITQPIKAADLAKEIKQNSFFGCWRALKATAPVTGIQEMPENLVDFLFPAGLLSRFLYTEKMRIDGKTNLKRKEIEFIGKLLYLQVAVKEVANNDGWIFLKQATLIDYLGIKYTQQIKVLREAGILQVNDSYCASSCGGSAFTKSYRIHSDYLKNLCTVFIFSPKEAKRRQAARVPPQSECPN